MVLLFRSRSNFVCRAQVTPPQETVRPRLNALIENKDKAIHLVSPLTNQPFPHLIPASSFASIYRPTLLESKATVEAANKPRIAKVMEARRAAAVAGGELRQFAPGAGNFTTLDFYDLAGKEAAAAQARALASMNSAAQSAVNIQNQAARNVTAISAANPELWGATQFAIAVRNGNAAQSKLIVIFARYFLLTRYSGSLVLTAATGKVVLAVVACSLMFKIIL